MTRLGARRMIHPLIALLLVAGCTPADSARESDAGVAEALPPGWRRARVAGLEIVAPAEFGVRSVKLPPEAEARLAEFENYSAEADSVHVNVTRATYRPGEVIDAMESANGSVHGMAAHPEMEGMTHAHARTEVSGRMAVRSTWRGTYGGQPLAGEILTFMDGAVLWQIKVTGTAAAQTAETAARVMPSVRIARKQARGG